MKEIARGSLWFCQCRSKPRPTRHSSSGRPTSTQLAGSRRSPTKTATAADERTWIGGPLFSLFFREKSENDRYAKQLC